MSTLLGRPWVAKLTQDPEVERALALGQARAACSSQLRGRDLGCGERRGHSLRDRAASTPRIRLHAHVAAPGQGVADPGIVGLPGKAALGAVNAAGEDELVPLVGAWLDVLAVDPDRRRAQEAQLGRGVTIDHFDELDRGLHS
jgi:hypothetical protein